MKRGNNIQQRFRLGWLTVLLLPFISYAQPDHPFYQNVTACAGGYRLPTMVLNHDTLPFVCLNWVTVEDKMSFHARKRYAEWTRIKSNVKIVYPYAILAAAKLKEYDLILAGMKNEKEKQKYLKKCEKELQKQFGDELKNLSVNQGKILMKLIDRETGKTTYTIVRELRGNFEAFIWQSLASLFGSSMKQEYNLDNENDKLIELAVRQVEAGEF